MPKRYWSDLKRKLTEEGSQLYENIVQLKMLAKCEKQMLLIQKEFAREIAAGGIWDNKDINKFLELGADGVQMATRFVTTYECDASNEFKEAYINAKEEDIKIISSPVGMPGRALYNEFIKSTENEKRKITKCYKCIKTCDIKNTPYCITKALINSVKGNLKEGLIFCGSNVDKVKELMTVHDLMEELAGV